MQNHILVFMAAVVSVGCAAPAAPGWSEVRTSCGLGDGEVKPVAWGSEGPH